MLLTQETGNNSFNLFGSSEIVVLVMYGGLILYLLFKLLKNNIAKKEVKGEINSFSKPISNMMKILGVIILVFGVFSIYQGQVASGILMILLVFTLFFYSTSKNIFGENGFAIDSKFVVWKNVKKWGFNPKTSELIVIHKKDFDTITSHMKLNIQDFEDVDSIFRKYKLNKK